MVSAHCVVAMVAELLITMDTLLKNIVGAECCSSAPTLIWVRSPVGILLESTHRFEFSFSPLRRCGLGCVVRVADQTKILNAVRRCVAIVG